MYNNFNATPRSTWPRNTESLQTVSSEKGLRKFTEYEKTEFNRILKELNGSRESITGAKDWVARHGHCCRDIAVSIREKTRSLGVYNFDQKLFILYLVNDVLHDSLCKRKRIEELDATSLSLLFVLPELTGRAAAKSGESEHNAIMALMRLWEDRLIYNRNTVSDLRKRMEDFKIKLNAESEEPVFAEELPKNTLHLPVGEVVDLSRGLLPYTPLDPRRVPFAPGIAPLNPDERVFAQLEALETSLGGIGSYESRSVSDYKMCFLH